MNLKIVISKCFSSEWPKVDDNATLEDLSERLAARLQSIPSVTSVSVESVDAGTGRAGFRGGYGHDWYEIVKFSIPVVLALGTYAGKKAVDVIADVIKGEITRKILERYGRVTKIEIYGADGEVVNTIEKPQ